MAASRSRQAARRQAARSTRPTPAPLTAGTSPALRRPDALIVVTGPGPRKGRAKGGGQPAGNGRGLSDWSKPANLPYSISVTTCDSRWSA